MSDVGSLAERLLSRVSAAGDEPIGRLIVDEVWLAAVDEAPLRATVIPEPEAAPGAEDPA